MSDTVAVTDQDFEQAKADTIENLVRMIQVGEQLGKPHGLIVGEFMAAVNQAAEATNG